jgi:hypothetical protein
MARPLTFRHDGAEIALSMEKLDRTKLYGSVEVEALDERGRRCELATLAPDGKTLLGKGGQAAGFLSPEGRWLDRAGLRAVNVEGEEIHPVPASFGAPLALDRTATVEEYLSHNIKSIYFLELGDGEAAGALAASLRAGTIYTFPYSFRGGLVADVGFLLAGQGDGAFLAVGQPTHLHFLGLDQLPGYEDEEVAAADEDLTFDML